MSLFRKHGARRQSIRESRPDTQSRVWAEMRATGAVTSLAIAAIFCVIAVGILWMREEAVAYRPGQFVPYDITARVKFTINDKGELTRHRDEARKIEPHVYVLNGDQWTAIESMLLGLPAKVSKLKENELDSTLRSVLDAGALTKLQEYASPSRADAYGESVKKYVGEIRKLNPIVLDAERSAEEVDRYIQIPAIGAVKGENTYSISNLTPLRERLQSFAESNFLAVLQSKIVDLTLRHLQPTHRFDELATTDAQNKASERIPESAGDITYNPKDVLIPKGEVVTYDGWQRLRAENAAYLASISELRFGQRVGLIGTVVILTIALAGYVSLYQPRIIRNHARAAALSVLLLSMLLLAQLAGIGSSPMYLFGIAPTIIVAMILAIAYDQRFAVGVATIHAILVTLALNSGLSFLLIAVSGVLSSCFMLNEVRTRQKLIEAGGMAAIAMIFTSAMGGMINLDPLRFIMMNCLYAGAAGLGCGFVVLGILPFIERAFRITTAMTLLELADQSQPLLKRVAQEAPGTYNHSLQVATLSEAGAEAIGANSLLCRVGAYYHDVGKIHKAEYFVENQYDGQNRHINLSPSVSLLIIIGHVKDGIELAKEYNLPTSIFPFIQQHHGTTVVEFFYRRACDNADPDQPAISETQYRYPGPKPKSKEIAIVMLADSVESATRTMVEPTVSRIESLVHDLAMKRLLDGQFDECDLTMRELELVERALLKSVLSIYHGRIAYPSTASLTQATGPSDPGTQIRTA
jgi:putative nucleotidyltransferase with HDIG domain